MRRLPVARPAFDFTLPATSVARPFALFLVLVFTPHVSQSGRATVLHFVRRALTDSDGTAERARAERADKPLV